MVSAGDLHLIHLNEVSGEFNANLKKQTRRLPRLTCTLYLVGLRQVNDCIKCGIGVIAEAYRVEYSHPQLPGWRHAD